jgi:hypothetical protein
LGGRRYRVIGRYLTINDRDLLLHSERTPHSTVDAVEHHEQRITTGVDDPATIRSYRRVYDLAP